MKLKKKKILNRKFRNCSGNGEVQKTKNLRGKICLPNKKKVNNNEPEICV